MYVASKLGSYAGQCGLAVGRLHGVPTPPPRRRGREKVCRGFTTVLAGASRLRGSSLFCAPSAAALMSATDEPSDHEYGAHESDDHACADEQIGENDSCAALDGHRVRQSGGWPPRFIALRCFNIDSPSRTRFMPGR